LKGGTKEGMKDGREERKETISTMGRALCKMRMLKGALQASTPTFLTFGRSWPGTFC
jgi:hypothetical protein